MKGGHLWVYWIEEEMTETLCGAMLEIGDDEGDGGATMHCQLSHGHAGLHREAYFREGWGEKKYRVLVQWEFDDRENEYIDIHSLLEDLMPIPPSIDEIRTWTDARRAQVKDWALWQDFPDLIEIYPRPEWLFMEYPR